MVKRVYVVSSRCERVDPWGWDLASADFCRGTATRSFPTREKRGHMHHSAHTELAQHMRTRWLSAKGGMRMIELS